MRHGRPVRHGNVLRSRIRPTVLLRRCTRHPPPTAALLRAWCTKQMPCFMSAGLFRRPNVAVAASHSHGATACSHVDALIRPGRQLGSSGTDAERIGEVSAGLGSSGRVVPRVTGGEADESLWESSSQSEVTPSAVHAAPSPDWWVRCTKPDSGSPSLCNPLCFPIRSPKRAWLPPLYMADA